SDAQRVQLMTIHVSKGLQFPVVFVPMAWRYRTPGWSDLGSKMARYHDANGQSRLDLGTSEFDQRKAIEHREQLQERMRLLYVALTRAELATYVYAFDDLTPSADLEPSQRSALDALLAAALAHSPESDKGDAWDALQSAIPTLAVNRKTYPETSMRSAAGADHVRTARAPMPRQRPYFGLYSFTSLLRNIPASLEPPFAAEDEGQEGVETDDLDTGAAAEDAAHPDLLALRDVKGPRFGNAVHGLLETAASYPDFAPQRDGIEQALAAEGIRLGNAQARSTLTRVADLLERTVGTELTPGLRQAGLELHRRRAEFEFAFAVRGSRWDRVQALLEQHDLGHWWPGTDGPVVLNGLMKGFVDLVFEWDGRFHVLDYKTNYLGLQLEDYAGPKLDQAMLDHHYGLQALVYTVAVHRYLGRRLDDYQPELHLGEAWYLFVRAVGLSDGLGVWRHRFPTALIVAVD
ncbi:MAG: PD-(D/E)XK nuclease family protein, partial [Xanthomonadales bacterium]|nr:PD-(D/E)XK nuclease family protein [Xanthomonadales bacterium]